MIIREAAVQDLHALQALSAQLGYECSLSELSQRLKEILNTPGHQIYVAEDDSVICGYIHLNTYKSLYYDSTLNIMGIVVDSNCRGRGIGTALLEKSREFALRTGCSGIRALSGSQREKAHDFYIRNSFDYFSDKKLFVQKY